MKKFRPKFGRLSSAVIFDHNSEQKIRKFGNYKPFENYEHCIELLIHYTLKYYQLRGRQEESFQKKILIKYILYFTNFIIVLACVNRLPKLAFICQGKWQI